METGIAQALFNHRSIAYVVTDRELTITDSGGALEALSTLELSLDTISEKGTSLYEFSYELIGYEEELKAILDGELEQHQLDLINRDLDNGQTQYILLQSFPKRDGEGNITGLVHVVEDVSDLGHLRQQLTQQRNELLLLSHQLSTRNLNLNAANSELRQLDDMKTRFVSTAAHELRTPLSTISGYVEILLEPGFEPLTDNQLKCLQVVERNTQRLIRITDDLLDVTSLEAGRIDLLLRPVDFTTLIALAIKDHQLHFDAKHQEVRVEIDENLPKVLCDESRTMQILANLVSNANKYTPDSGTITLRLQLADVEGYILFSIEDTGIGVPEKDKPQLFGRLYRASNVYQTGVSGAGLGLYIVHSLVELHGGRIWLESKEGKGTTFYVTLPIDDGLFGF